MQLFRIELKIIYNIEYITTQRRGRSRSEPVPPNAMSLDDKYERRNGRIYITGNQALVRAAMMQRWRDEKAGLNTAGFISDYRGSPLHNVDKEL